MNSRVLNIFLCVSSLIAGWLFTTTLVASVHYLRPGPGFDYWTGAMPFLRAAIDGPWQWPLLWEYYAGAHRLLLSRVLFLVEWLVSDFRGYCLLAFSWLALLASAVIMAKAVWAEKAFDKTSRWLCLLLIIFGLGSAHHLNNLVYTFNQQWTSGLLLVLLAIKGVMACQRENTRRKAIAYAALALLCTFLLAMTTFSILAIIVTWLALCWLLALRWPITVGVFVCLLLAFIATVASLPLLDALASNGIGSDNLPLFILQALLYLTLNSLRYLGSPLTEYSQPAGVTLAFAALLLLVVVAVQHKRQHLVNPLVVLATAYAVFVTGMALSTAVGRLEPHHAINPRFRTFIVPFLVFAGIVCVYQIQNYKPTLRVALSTVLLAAALLVIVPGHLRQMFKFSEEYDLYLPGSIALASGFSDVSVVHESRFAMFQKVDNVQMLKYRDFMQHHQRGIFASDFYQQIGKHVDLGKLSTTNSDTTVTAIKGGGYLWQGTTEQCGADGRVAVADTSGTVIASGMVNRKLTASGWQQLYEVFLPYCRAGHAAAWRAYIPPTASNSNAPFYALVFVKQMPQMLARTELPVTP